MSKSINTLIVIAGLVSSVAAAEPPSVEHGRQLFDSTALGTNGRSCSTCHAGGKGLEDVSGFDDAKLEMIINQCIQKPLKGQALATDSNELRSLVMYLRTFANVDGK